MPTCPKCGSAKNIPIVYGKPSTELMEKAERGEVALGGCIITPDRNLYKCKVCGTGFR